MVNICLKGANKAYYFLVLCLYFLVLFGENREIWRTGGGQMVEEIRRTCFCEVFWYRSKPSRIKGLRRFEYLFQG